MTLSNPDPIQGNRVLLVDDDEGMQSSFRRILRVEGYEVDIAGSAAAARDRENWVEYFAILLDRRLPDGSAEELLPEFKRIAPNAAVLIVTGYADMESSIVALRAGADDYLQKPVEPEALLARLRGFAELRRVHDEKRRMEARLRESEERFRQLTENIDSVFWLRDRNEGLYLSPAFEKVYGLSCEDVLADSQPFFDLIHPDDRERVRENIQSPPSGRYEYDYRIRRPDGDERWIHTRAFPVPDDSGVQRYAGVSVDRTNERIAASELQTERDFAKNLVDTANAIVLVLDRKARVLQFNQFAEQLTGYTLEDARGADWFTKFLPERERARVRLVFDRAIAGEPVEGVVNSINTKSGERDITWFARAVYDSDGEITGVLSIGHDITDLRDAQRQLVQSERLAAIGQMMTGLAHESRNALQRAGAALDILSLELEGQDDQLVLTKRISRALEDLGRLYEEVKHYAAPIKLDQRVEDLQAIWRSVWVDVTETNTQRMELTESIGSDSLKCKVDRYRLEQVFRNIFENAAAACGDECLMTIQAEASALLDLPALRIRFRDNGPGFPVENREQVFVPFFTTKQKGTGLGMAISKRIIESHGGTIEIGDYSDGAEIIMTLPITA
ncbi:MAG: PAS domain S-box protein [Planctomycetaceae bacterium]